MLRRLAIKNYALIDSLDIEFPENLIVISGETGAGKSILLGALSLLLGFRADVSVLGDKTVNCVVEAEFEKEGEEYIIRRVITPQGRSRAFVNDEPVPLEDLRELASHLVDIHAQYNQSFLSERAYQLTLLDSYAGITAEVKAYAERYDKWRETGRRIADLEVEIEQTRKNRDYMEFQFQQLSDANLKDGEQEELESEQRQLAGSEQIRENLAAVDAVFSSEDNSPDMQLRAIESALAKVASYIPEFEPLRERIESAKIELKDIEYEVSSMADRISFSPERLEYVDNRLSQIYDLLRKHGVSTVAELIEIRDGFSEQLGNALDSDAALSRLKAELSDLDASCAASAASISASRKAVAPKLAAALQDLIRSLEMPQAIFQVCIQDKPSRGRDGQDEVVFSFSANSGIAPKELSKCASGGEMSRIMLCIKKLFSAFVGMPSMIFDEIDTGVSGSVADKMGRMIVDMGAGMQVFAITHLPQVASKGRAHYLVYKEVKDGRTSSHIRAIEGAEREREIARMLSGETLTPEALANARVLLNQK